MSVMLASPLAWLSSLGEIRQFSSAAPSLPNYRSTQGVSEGTYRAERKQLKAEADAELEPLWQRVYRVQEKSYQESAKHERYCREQRELLRALEDLAAAERVMHELDNRKDQIMTICKVALANLVMWVRDRFFPSTYAHATRASLATLFSLARSGTVGPRGGPR